MFRFQIVLHLVAQYQWIQEVDFQNTALICISIIECICHSLNEYTNRIIYLFIYLFIHLSIHLSDSCHGNNSILKAECNREQSLSPSQCSMWQRRKVPAQYYNICFCTRFFINYNGALTDSFAVSCSAVNHWMPFSSLKFLMNTSSDNHYEGILKVLQKETAHINSGYSAK